VLPDPEVAAGGALQHGVVVLPAEEHQDHSPADANGKGWTRTSWTPSCPANRAWSASAADMDNNRPLYAGPEMPGAGQTTAAADPPEAGPGD
jgi:hypothetical protein